MVSLRRTLAMAHWYASMSFIDARKCKCGVGGGEFAGISTQALPPLKSWRWPHVGWTTNPQLPLFHPPLQFYPFPFRPLFSSLEVWGKRAKLPMLPSRNDIQSQKLDGTEYSWSPLSAELEVTHRAGPSHRATAPMQIRVCSIDCRSLNTLSVA